MAEAMARAGLVGHVARPKGDGGARGGVRGGAFQGA